MASRFSANLVRVHTSLIFSFFHRPSRNLARLREKRLVMAQSQRSRRYGATDRFCPRVQNSSKRRAFPRAHSTPRGSRRKTIIGIPLSRCWIRAWLSQGPMYSPAKAVVNGSANAHSTIKHPLAGSSRSLLSFTRSSASVPPGAIQPLRCFPIRCVAPCLVAPRPTEPPRYGS